MREIQVAVDVVDRRVLVAGIDTEFWLRTVSGIGLAIQPDIPPHRAEAQGGLLVPVNSVHEAEGRDTEQVGDEAIRGNEHLPSRSWQSPQSGRETAKKINDNDFNN